jgi:hypothetical protein
MTNYLTGEDVIEPFIVSLINMYIFLNSCGHKAENYSLDPDVRNPYGSSG